ncbi:TetR/AcrR family transcriptional regulator [Macrococcoides goetzii]|uniref:TetR/AcrR family transcriptional regulator n=1 Tax=Macrococcus TaxID=69965 RepID=UPI001EF1CF98|nr:MULTISPECIES: TetR/AcrR family transcriptional regulator [Macrococcus]MCG7419543.1 TetR/AcrR family transcriptional regulator [Macrococcus epidermidis]MCH4985233.1 TetR/AcrR family transcriptional regulator [Macrococcus sp. PK]
MTDKKTLIEYSFIQLMEHHRFRDITIKMICEESNINRSTFYAYFEDKYALLDSMIDFHIHNIEQFMTDNLNNLKDEEDKRPYVEKYLKETFQYIFDNKQFFKILLTLHPAQNFTQKLLSSWRENYLNVLNNTISLNYPDYFVSYTIGGQFGILYFWLQNDCPESPEVISKIIYNNILKINR